MEKNDHMVNYGDPAEAENAREGDAHPPHGQAGASSSSPQHSEEIQPPPLIVSPYRLRLPQVHHHQQQRQKSPSSPAAAAAGASSSSPMPISSHSHMMRSFRLYYGANTIGRCTPEHLEPNFISIDNANVALSRLHANITIAPNNDAWIRDLGSTNGTHLSIREGEGITADPQCFYQLCHGMVITLGDLPVLFVDSTIVPDEDVILGCGIDEKAHSEKTTADGHNDHRPSSSSPLNRANEDEQGRSTANEPQTKPNTSSSNHAVVASASSASAPELRLQTGALSLNKQSSRSVVADGAAPIRGGSTKQSGLADASPLPRRESTNGSRNNVRKHTTGEMATANETDDDDATNEQQLGRPYLEDDSETSLPAPPPRVVPMPIPPPHSTTNTLMERTASAHQKALSFMDDEEDYTPPPPNKRLHDQQVSSEIDLIRMQSSSARDPNSASSALFDPSGKSDMPNPPPLSGESEDDGYGAMMMRGATTNTVLEPTTTTNVMTTATSSASSPMGSKSKSTTKVSNKNPSGEADNTPDPARKPAPAAKKARAGKRAREEDQKDSEVDDDESSGNEKSNSTVPGKGKETKPSASKRGARPETPPAAASPNGKKAAAAAPATPAKKGGKKAPAAPAGKSAPSAPSPEGNKKASSSAADAQRAPTLVEFKNRLPSVYEWPETQKLNVCLSGMDTQDRERVANRIRLMGGAVLEEWNDRVTLLVVKDSPSVRTPKFLIAMSKGVMIVTCRFFLDQPAAEGGNLSRLLEFVPDLQHNGSIVPAADIVDTVMYHQQMRSLGFMPSGALSNTMFATAEMPPKIRNIVADVIVGSGGKVAKNKRDEARAATTGMRFVTLGADDADSLYDAIVTGSSSRFGH